MQKAWTGLVRSQWLSVCGICHHDLQSSWLPACKMLICIKLHVSTVMQAPAGPQRPTRPARCPPHEFPRCSKPAAFEREGAQRDQVRPPFTPATGTFMFTLYTCPLLHACRHCPQVISMIGQCNVLHCIVADLSYAVQLFEI